MKYLYRCIRKRETLHTSVPSCVLLKKELLGKKVNKLNLFVYTILFNKMGKRKASDNAGSPNQDLCDFLIGKLFVIYSVYIYFINDFLCIYILLMKLLWKIIKVEIPIT